jgi:membrane-bound serine protease (ClpP class)
MNIFRRLLLFTSWLAVAVGSLGIVHGYENHALVAKVDSPINSAIEVYIDRVFKEADVRGSSIVILILNTPGGDLDATRGIVGVMLKSQVPSVVYVSPSGARAASAGAFITAAAGIAAMAPGTNIGAASPVGVGGRELSATMASKATNDAAALLREIARVRQRNSGKLQDTVFFAASYSAKEAVDFSVVDMIATDLEDLLVKLDGVTVSTSIGSVTLETEQLVVMSMAMTLLERFLLLLANPNLAFLLLVLGGLGLSLELINPGLILPGIVGAILVLLAFLGLGNLPVNWIGVMFILLAFILFVIEIQVSGFGVLGGGSLISFALGTFLLFSNFGPGSQSTYATGIHLAVIVPTTFALLMGAALTFWTMRTSRRVLPSRARSRLVGVVGWAITDLTPRGIVLVDSEEWSAISKSDTMIIAGEEISVLDVSGILLYVIKSG